MAMRRTLMMSLVGALTLCCILCGGELSAADNESIESLRKEKLRVAQEWWSIIETREQLGAARAGLDMWHKAAKAVKDAELDIAADKPSRIRALTTYRQRLDKLNHWADQQSKAATIDIYELQELRIALIDAKIQLKQEEAKE
jgi:hypothetical protein